MILVGGRWLVGSVRVRHCVWRRREGGCVCRKPSVHTHLASILPLVRPVETRAGCMRRSRPASPAALVCARSLSGSGAGCTVQVERHVHAHVNGHVRLVHDCCSVVTCASRDVKRCDQVSRLDSSGKRRVQSSRLASMTEVVVDV